MKIRCQGSERFNLQCHLEIVESQRCPPPGGPFATDPFLDLLCKKTSKSWSCFAFLRGDVGQKPGFQKNKPNRRYSGSDPPGGTFEGCLVSWSLVCCIVSVVAISATGSGDRLKQVGSCR